MGWAFCFGSGSLNMNYEMYTVIFKPFQFVEGWGRKKQYF